MKKKILLTLFTFAILFVGITNISADTIEADGKVIYNSEGGVTTPVNGITYDEVTKTVTLDGYSGGNIIFGNGLSGKITVIVKTDSIINALDGMAIFTTNPGTSDLIIKGPGKLEVIVTNDYPSFGFSTFVGIKFQDANVDIADKNNPSITGIGGSEIEIINSNLKIINANHALSANKYLRIENSNIDIKAQNGYQNIFFASIGTDIKDSTINMNTKENCFNLKNAKFNIENSILNIESTNNFAFNLNGGTLNIQGGSFLATGSVDYGAIRMLNTLENSITFSEDLELKKGIKLMSLDDPSTPGAFITSFGNLSEGVGGVISGYERIVELGAKVVEQPIPAPNPDTSDNMIASIAMIIISLAGIRFILRKQSETKF